MARNSLIEFFLEYFPGNADVAFTAHSGYRTKRRSYQQVAADARRFARELEARGIAKGDAVLLWAENSAEWAVVFWGCLLRGAVVGPIDGVTTRAFSYGVTPSRY